MNLLIIILAVLSAGNWIAIAAIGIPILGTLGWLIFKTGGLYTLIVEMKPNVEKIPVIESRVNELWKRKMTVSDSPSVLNEYGKKILSESKINVILSPYYDEIIKSVKDKQPSNAFQGQKSLIEIVAGFEKKEEIKNNLEKAAFHAGTDVNTILFVAAINIRDRVISELGFERNEIDEHDPENKENNK